MKSLDEYIRRHSKTHVIFDFDATLFLLVLPWSEWIEDVKRKLSSYDAAIWDTYHQGVINISELQNHYMQNHGETIREFLRSYSQDFEETRLEAVKHNHELLSLVRSLDESIKKYIWSSNSRKTIDAVLRETNMEDVFTSIVTRDNVQYLKPNPDGFRHIYTPGTDKSSYLLVGDSRSDRGAAQSAGIDFFYTDSFDIRL